MAAAYFPMNTSPATRPGQELLDTLATINEAFARLKLIRAAMIQQRDGDGSQSAHYAAVTPLYGFASDAVSKAAFEELDSFVSGNAQAPLEQCCARFKQ